MASVNEVRSSEETSRRGDGVNRFGNQTLARAGNSQVRSSPDATERHRMLTLGLDTGFPVPDRPIFVSSENVSRFQHLLISDAHYIQHGIVRQLPVLIQQHQRNQQQEQFLSDRRPDINEHLSRSDQSLSMAGAGNSDQDRAGNIRHPLTDLRDAVKNSHDVAAAIAALEKQTVPQDDEEDPAIAKNYDTSVDDPKTFPLLPLITRHQSEPLNRRTGGSLFGKWSLPDVQRIQTTFTHISDLEGITDPDVILQILNSHSEIDYLYMSPTLTLSDPNYSPYLMQLVDPGGVDIHNCCVVTRKKVLRYIKGKEPHCLSLKRWSFEQKVMFKLRAKSFFKNFKLIKAFSALGQHLDMSAFGKIKRKLRSQLFTCNPSYAETLLLVRTMCLDMAALSLFRIDAELTYTLVEFIEEQEQHFQEVMTKLERIFSILIHLVSRMCWDDVIMAGLAEERKERRGGAPKRVNELRKMQRLRQSPARNGSPRQAVDDVNIGMWIRNTDPMESEEMEIRKKEKCKRLFRFIYLVDCLILDALFQMFFVSLQASAGFLSLHLETFPSNEEIRTLVGSYVGDIVLSDLFNNHNSDNDSGGGGHVVTGQPDTDLEKILQPENPRDKKKSMEEGSNEHYRTGTSQGPRNPEGETGLYRSRPSTEMDTSLTWTTLRMSSSAGRLVTDTSGIVTSSATDNALYSLAHGEHDLTDSITTSSSTLSEEQGNVNPMAESQINIPQQAANDDLHIPTLFGTGTASFTLHYSQTQNEQGNPGEHDVDPDDVTVIERVSTTSTNQNDSSVNGRGFSSAKNKLHVFHIKQIDVEEQEEDLTITSDEKSCFSSKLKNTQSNNFASNTQVFGGSGFQSISDKPHSENAPKRTLDRALAILQEQEENIDSDNSESIYSLQKDCPSSYTETESDSCNFGLPITNFAINVTNSLPFNSGENSRSTSNINSTEMNTMSGEDIRIRIEQANPVTSSVETRHASTSERKPEAAGYTKLYSTCSPNYNTRVNSSTHAVSYRIQGARTQIISSAADNAFKKSYIAGMFSCLLKQNMESSVDSLYLTGHEKKNLVVLPTLDSSVLLSESSRNYTNIRHSRSSSVDHDDVSGIPDVTISPWSIKSHVKFAENEGTLVRSQEVDLTRSNGISEEDTTTSLDSSGRFEELSEPEDTVLKGRNKNVSHNYPKDAVMEIINRHVSHNYPKDAVMEDINRHVSHNYPKDAATVARNRNVSHNYPKDIAIEERNRNVSYHYPKDAAMKDRKRNIYINNPRDTAMKERNINVSHNNPKDTDKTQTDKAVTGQDITDVLNSDGIQNSPRTDDHTVIYPVTEYQSNNLGLTNEFENDVGHINNDGFINEETDYYDKENEIFYLNANPSPSSEETTAVNSFEFFINRGSDVYLNPNDILGVKNNLPATDDGNFDGYVFIDDLTSGVRKDGGKRKKVGKINRNGESSQESAAVSNPNFVLRESIEEANEELMAIEESTQERNKTMSSSLTTKENDAANSTAVSKSSPSVLTEDSSHARTIQQLANVLPGDLPKLLQLDAPKKRYSDETEFNRSSHGQEIHFNSMDSSYAKTDSERSIAYTESNVESLIDVPKVAMRIDEDIPEETTNAEMGIVENDTENDLTDGVLESTSNEIIARDSANGTEVKFMTRTEGLKTPELGKIKLDSNDEKDLEENEDAKENQESEEKVDEGKGLDDGGGGGGGSNGGTSLAKKRGISDLKPMFHASLIIDKELVRMTPDLYDFTAASFNIIHFMEQRLHGVQGLSTNPAFVTFALPNTDNSSVDKKHKGPNIERVFRFDRSVTSEKNNIYGNIEKMFHSVDVYVKEMQNLYLKYFKSWIVDFDIDLKDVDFYCKLLQRYDVQLKIVERLPESQRLGMFLIDLTPYKEVVRRCSTESLQRVQLEINADIVQRIRVLTEKLNELHLILESQPTTLVPLFRRLTTLDTINESLENIELKEIRQIGALYSIIDRFDVPHTVVDRRAYESVHYLVSNARRLGNSCRKDRNNILNSIEVCLSRDVRYLHVQVKKVIRPLVEEELSIDGRSDPTEVRRTLAEYETMVKSYVSMANYVREVQRYLEQSFLTLDVQEINNYTFRYMDASDKLEKLLPKNTVITVFEEKMDVMLRWLNFIIEFRGQAVKPRHWNQIEEILGVEFGEQLPLSLASLMSINAIEKHKSLHVILNKARAEANVQHEFDEVSQQCRSLTLSLQTRQKSLVDGEEPRTIHLLGDTFEIEESLNYFVMELERIELSPHAGFLHTVVEEFVQSIFEALEKLVQWMEMQMKLSRLRRLIIRHPEVSETMPVELTRYKQLYLNYSQFLETVLQDPSVMRWCTSIELRDLIESQHDDIIRLYRTFKRDIEGRIGQDNMQQEAQRQFGNWIVM